jgi:hypothetical protein
MMEKFGNKNFVPSIIDKAMAEVKQKYGPDVKVGKIAMGSFSAGYAPLQVALSNPEVRAKTDAVIVLDGIHYGKYGQPDPAGHKPFVDFAREASAGDKLMVISHSSIKTDYSSSTNAADYILGQVGVNRTTVNNPQIYDNRYPSRYNTVIEPETRADLNGFHVEGYNGKVGNSHVEQIDNIGNIWNEYLAPRWKQ